MGYVKSSVIEVFSLDEVSLDTAKPSQTLALRCDWNCETEKYGLRIVACAAYHGKLFRTVACLVYFTIFNSVKPYWRKLIPMGIKTFLWNPESYFLISYMEIFL